MGAQHSDEFENEDYTLQYDDDFVIQRGPSLREWHHTKDKSVRVLIDKGIIETIPIPDNDLTVGWLLSEVNRRYDQIYEDEEKAWSLPPKKFIVGLKSVSGFTSLDFYLTSLDNLLSPIKSKTSLTVHFAKINQKDGVVLKSDKITIDDFKILKIIGRGSYSYVAVARKKDSGRMYAIKIMKKQKLFEKVSKTVFANESDINKKFRGTPFVAETYYAFQTEAEMFLVMELWPGGTLFDYLKKIPRDTLNYDIVRFYIAEIVMALEFVHAKNVMYRDLKPENIIIDIGKLLNRTLQKSFMISLSKTKDMKNY